MDGNGNNTSPIVNPRAALFSEDIPALEAVISFLKEKWLAFFKGASLVFGFSIFLVYFVQNSFYPDVDLLGFGSLLLISAFVGACLTAYLAFGLAVPSVIWKEFYRDTEVRAEISGHFPTDEVDREMKKFYGWALFPGFVVPVILAAAATLLLNLLDLESSGRVTVMLCVPLLCSAVVAQRAQKKYSLSSVSRWKCLVFAFLAYLVATLVLLLLCFAIFKGQMFETGAENVYVTLLMAFALSILLMLTMSIVLHLKRSYAFLIGFFVGLLAMAVSGVWSTMPGAVVRNLGIGNYTAESVLLKDDECKRLKLAKYPVADDCSLRDVHVVWAWAGSYQFRLTDGRRIRIEKDSVGPIVEPPKTAATHRGAAGAKTQS